MTRRWVFGVAAAMIVCMLGGCTHGGKQGDTTDLEEVLFTDAQTEAIDPSEYPQMQYDAQNDWYWIEGGGTYRLSPLSYEPVAVGEIVAVFGDSAIYKITGVPQTEYLTPEYDGTGGIFYRAEGSLPSLREMAPQRIIICVQEKLTLGVAQVQDAAVIDALIDRLENGADVGMEKSENVYQLKFESDEYPAFYYRVTYLEKKDGLCCLYDRDSKKTVEIGSLLQEYIYTADELESLAEAEQSAQT